MKYYYVVAFVTNQLNLLGLNEREIRVFTALSTFGRMGMTQIAGRSGVSRTTVDYIVRSLIAQGIVSREKVGKHWEYSVVLADVAEKLHELQEKLGHNRATGSVEKIVSSSDPNLQSAVVDAFNCHGGERVSVLLGSLATETHRVATIVHLLHTAHNNMSKLSILATRDVTKVFECHSRVLRDLYNEKLLVLSVLPSSFGVQGMDTISFRDEVLVVDYVKQGLERITGESAAGVVRHLLFIAHEAGWQIDLEPYLNNLVERMPRT